MSHVAFSIQYAGITLPVIKRAAGEEIVPLKPLADAFGLSWEDQRKKVTGSAYLAEFLGVCTGDIPGIAGRDPVCILLSRVAAYLMTLNPDRIKAAGNVSGAKFLIAKQNEWADALHDYEQLGVAVNLNHDRVKEALRRDRLAFFRGIGLLNRTEDTAARKAMQQVLMTMAAEIGAPYQPELLTG